MPDAAVAAAFSELYAACGEPAPAIRIVSREGDYLSMVDALSWADPGEGVMQSCRMLFAFGVSFCAFGALSGALQGVEWMSGRPEFDWSWVPAEVFLSGCLMTAACFVISSGGAVGMRRFTRLKRSGLLGVAATPTGMEAVLGSALRGAMPDDGGGAAEPVSFLDGCFRLGRRRVGPAAPDARRNALVGRPFAEEAPRVMRLAAAASALVEEAVLMEGVVLAFVPGAAGEFRIVGAPGEGISARVPPPAEDAAAAALRRIVGIAMASRLVEAEAMLRLVGLDAAVASMGSLPFAEDSSGRLHRLRADLCMVRVQDEVSGPDRKPLVHWVTVPPHVVTAREAVAWSFGLGEGDYAPTAQS